MHVCLHKHTCIAQTIISQKKTKIYEINIIYEISTDLENKNNNLRGRLTCNESYFAYTSVS